jgi:hypothetical protein
MAEYTVRRVHLGKTAQLDALAHACGELYTQTLVFALRAPSGIRGCGSNPST